MSRVPKWKVEKAKVKVVFRLQFHATHIPQPGWDKLFVSFIPTDTGKATAKTTKANVRNGNCKWSDPIYETTRLLQDTRSRKYDAKLYKLVVAMGSSRSSILGEVIINLADFADASKPSSVDLPLKGCDCGAVLHVTVQLLTSKTGFREFEQQRELSAKGFQMPSGQRSHEPVGTAAASLEIGSEQLDKVNNARVRFKEKFADLPLLEEVGESTEDYEDSAAGLDGSSNTSGSLYAEKNEISSMHEVDSLKSMASADLSAPALFQSPRIVKGDVRDVRLPKQGSSEWNHGWSSDYSADNDQVTAHEENSRLRLRLEGAEAAFLQLKTETKSLQSLCDELGSETQSLAGKLSLELASGEKLTTELSILKSECYKFRKELEELKSATLMQSVSSNRTPSNGTMMADAFSADQDSFSNHHQANWLQGLLLLERKVQEIQNKARIGYNGSDFDFLISDFDVLQGILLNLKRELTDKYCLKETKLKTNLQTDCSIQGHGLERSQIDHHPEGMLHSSINSHPLKKSNDAASILEERMCELLEKLEASDAEKELLTKKMDQMECYYEALIQELEEGRHKTVNELENLRTEYSSCLYTNSALQSQIEKLQQDTSEQFLRFASDRHNLDSLNKNLEKRAIASEAALKRVRLNYAIAVDRLQKDLELLSFQVLSMYETNENLAKNTLTEASQLFPHDIPMENPEEQYRLAKSGGHTRDVDLRANNEERSCMNGLKFENIQTSSPLKRAQKEKGLVFHCDKRNGLADGSPIFEPKCDSQNQSVESNSQLVDGNVGSEEKRRSLHTPQNLQEDIHAELSEMHMLNIHWEVFMEVLKEAMHSANDGVLHMKEDMSKLVENLRLSTSEKESLMLNLHSTLDDIRKLRKNGANCRSECDDLMLKNNILEARIIDVSEENSSLSQKIAEYESKYTSCLEQRNKFEVMLEKESLQRSSLQSEIKSIDKDYKALKEEFDNLSSKNCTLEITIDHLQKKLGDLCHNITTFSKEIDGFTFDDPSLKRETESNNHAAIVSHLEKFQHEAYKKILQLHRAKKEIEQDRDTARCSLNETESQLLHVKAKFESGLEESKMNLELSNTLVEKLRLELQDVADKLSFSLEAEEKLRSTNRELSTKLTILDIEIQQANDEKRDISHKLLQFDNVKEELERTNLRLMECMQENKSLMMCVESGKLAYTQLETELSNLQEDLRCAHDNLHAERGSRENLEATVSDFTLQLKERGQELLSFDEQKSELIMLRKRIAGLETEMQNFLCNSEKQRRKYDDEVSSLHLQIADLQYYLAEVLDHSFSADIKFTYLKCQKLLEFNNFKEELERINFRLIDCMQENRALMMSIESEKVISKQLENEISNLKECLKCACDNLHSERGLRDELEATVTDLTLQLKEKSHQLLYSDERKSELVALRKRIIDLETEMQHFQFKAEEYRGKYDNEVSSQHLLISDQEYNFAEVLDHFLTAEIKFTYLKCEFQLRREELVEQNKALQGEFEELHLKHNDVVASLRDHMATEAQVADENARLSTDLQSLKAELEVVVREKEDLLGNTNEKSSVLSAFENMKARAATLEANSIREKLKYEDEICQFRNMLVRLEKEVEDLGLSKAELETTAIILQSKLNDQQARISLREECEYELERLKGQHNELSYKLAEQILKTEEFKNLSIHLRELKDKAEAECLQARERREAEGASVAMQDSLRIAFIKEQCESKLQEMKSQLCASKKYSEEMLLKLQTALDEVEIGKRSEASLAKRNEELAMKISDMEAELHEVVTDRRELAKACDGMKTELECTTLSLDCCKEERLKLEVSLQEFSEERTRLRVELDLVKRLLENMASSAADIEVQKNQPNNQSTTSIGEILEDGNSPSSGRQETPNLNADCLDKGLGTKAGEDDVNSDDRLKLPSMSSMSSSSREVQSAHVTVNSRQQSLPNSQNALATRSSINKETLLENGQNHIDDIKEHFRAQQKLLTSMDVFHRELERFKNDNLSSIVPLEDHHFDSALHDLQSDLSQLEKANEHLGSIFPSFKELRGCGNALERVLALELELADALQAKKTDIHFQSSFLKQHSDDEAVFQSFRDINELLKDMLALKKRNATIETELKEMQERYSQLSLKFAEVEGERQQLVMTLKIRSPNKS
ncbi:uncharacterized protein A4U43_C03F17480 [Asparagus officinalis]|uniref:C2 NT-type domain-containing protein n=1 Tax=Asparagus officinalis TaxID=4686 RepID=A0A5P1FCL3_ASPOF|nr:nucleoporin nup211 [Asparagus officinalis]ONK75493.1 uncharacterized protein A4U43_C03F17480 [Asparagus officinalis]